MASETTIKKELTALGVAYPYSGIGPEQVQQLKKVWSDDFTDATDQEFREAVALHRRSSRFFPSPADVRACLGEVRKNPPKQSGCEALPQTPGRLSEEERRKGKERLAEIRAMLAGNKVNKGDENGRK